MNNDKGLPDVLPTHVAIIMDGNGRWATNQGNERLYGHRAGAKTVKTITTYAREIGIKALTLYAFSEQNWGRPTDEIDGLMALLSEFIINERDTVLSNGIRFSTIGDTSRLPWQLQELILELKAVSSSNDAMDFCIALSYGGQEEIIHAVKMIAADCVNKVITPEEITPEAFEKKLFTSHLPPLDLLIRTSGEYRLSNFLLWQVAYAELYFTDVPWPDFTAEHFNKALCSYSGRDRRYGLVETAIGVLTIPK
jgi:undecaprenyl diphosphate synthase